MDTFSDALTVRSEAGRVGQGQGEASIIGSDPHPLLVCWEVPAAARRGCMVHRCPGVSGDLACAGLAQESWNVWLRAW
jgi:hypothetical protein